MSKDYINKVYQDKYKVEKEIPGGEYEYAFKGQDLKDNKPVHIRIIPIDPDHPELMEQTQNFVFKEVSLLQRLRHPGLPVFIESLSTKEENIIITEYMECIPLSEKLDKNPQLSEDEVLDFLNKLLPIMDYLHSQTPPVIYRDLKPQSIFTDAAGSLHLTKYEGARTFKADKIKDTVIHASRGYSPPEQAFGKGQSDARSDIYSVGMIIFQMFTGKDPTKAPLILPKISDLRPEVNAGWSAIVSKATNIKVDKRYSSVKEVVRDLEKLKSGSAITEDDREAPRKAGPEPAKAEEPKKKIAMGHTTAPPVEEKKPEPPAAEKVPEVKAAPEPVKPEPARVEEKKAEPPKAETPKAETPKAEPLKAEEPKGQKAQEKKTEERAQKTSESPKKEEKKAEQQKQPPAKTAPPPVEVVEETRSEPNPWAYFLMGVDGFILILLIVFVVMGQTMPILISTVLFIIVALLSYTLYNSSKDRTDSPDNKR